MVNKNPGLISVADLGRRDAMKLAIAGTGVALAASNTSNAYGVDLSEKSETFHDLSINDDWLFQRGDISGAQATSFADDQWQVVHLPHDYMTDDVSSTAGDQATADPAPWSSATGPSTIGPFTNAPPADAAMAWIPGVVGWYRKYFLCPRVANGGKVVIRFDGIFQDVDIYLNGSHVAFHPYGYTSFTCDLTSFLVADRPNVLALRVNPSGLSARWYAGGGINRNVWLSSFGPVSIPYAGICVRTQDISKQSANVQVISRIDASRVYPNVLLVVTAIDASGRNVATTYVRDHLAEGSIEITTQLTLQNPKLWSIDTPHLYSIKVKLLDGGRRQLHARETTFGIRKVTIDATKGFCLNDVPIKLEGGCVHSTYGVLGSAAIDAASYQHVSWLKAAGFNAIRTAHNPPSPEFLDACDLIGLLVYEEAFDVWDTAKTAQDYHLYFPAYGTTDITSMVVRDRNHPCVVLWSIGNEINNGAATPDQLAYEQRLYATVRNNDPTRLITLGGAASGGAHPTALYAGNQTNYVDLVDLHYTVTLYPAAHAAYPKKPVITSESWPYQVYDNWLALQSYPYAIGDFVWTALDYLGESGVGQVFLGPVGTPSPSFPKTGLTAPFPWFVSGSGDISLTGVRRAQSYYRDVVWGRSDLEVFVQRPTPQGEVQVFSLWGWYDELASWTWPGSEGKNLFVDVYTSGDRVDLLVNDVVIASKIVSGSDARMAQFSVTYVAGRLKAIAYRGGIVLATSTLTTVGEAAAIRLITDRQTITRSRSDLAYVYAEVVDGSGQLVPDAVVEVSFTLGGEGVIAGVGNGNPRNMASFKKPSHYTFHGTALVVLRPDGLAGEMNLTATSDGLRSASLKICTV